ncbi:hypothetical protein E7Y35_05790 [Spiroplasma sp. SV19]|nr:hypothetical protein E7Y35_05790 [Spiroplasma sp. SV19]
MYRKITEELINLKFIIVSGLAKGIDYLTHEICKNYEYKNIIAVIGTPLSKFYPKENKNLQIWIKSNGLLLSEYAIFENTLKYNFLRRNNFMSIVSIASLVVEASDTSGTISQARSSLKNGRHLLTTKLSFENKENSWPSKFRDKYSDLVHVFNDRNDFLITINYVFKKSIT